MNSSGLPDKGIFQDKTRTLLSLLRRTAVSLSLVIVSWTVVTTAQTGKSPGEHTQSERLAAVMAASLGFHMQQWLEDARGQPVGSPSASMAWASINIAIESAARVLEISLTETV